MNKKLLYPAVIIGFLAVAFLIWYFLTSRITTQIIDKDSSFAGNLLIEKNKRLLVKNSAKLTIEGDFKIEGLIECQDGGLNAEIGGSLVVDKNITCNRTEKVLNKDEVPFGISLVVQKGVMIGEKATVISNSHVQIVDSPEKLISTTDQIINLYDEAARDTGKGPRIGPFTEGSQTSQVNITTTKKELAKKGVLNFLSGILTPKLEAAEEERWDCYVALGCFQMSGTWVIGDPGQLAPRNLRISSPPEGVDRILVNFNFGQGQRMNFQNFTLYGPNARAGNDDAGQTCDAIGGNGQDAMRMLVRAGKIAINNFNLYLGNGGNGGNAETKRDCPEARATGGHGGSPGNFKIMAELGLRILGAFNIYPGNGGNGGNATAYGQNGSDGFPNGADGGNAVATAGNGASNIKNLRSAGEIRDLNLLEVMQARGGNGGQALAIGGNGGNGLDCPSGIRGGDGGKGGNASTVGGFGGNADLTILGVRSATTGGAGGGAIARGGFGGEGGRCKFSGEIYQNGGNGGDGGNAIGQAGTGGSGSVGNGNDGVTEQPGGNGGKGGDGCQPGNGGKGGTGDPAGVDGANGLNLCRERTQTEAAPTPTATKEKISVIQYQGKFLPVTQLIQEKGQECNEAQHWHAAAGTVTATDGAVVADPGGCGFGTIEEAPVEEIDAP